MKILHENGVKNDIEMDIWIVKAQFAWCRFLSMSAERISEPGCELKIQTLPFYVVSAVSLCSGYIVLNITP